MEPLLVLPNRPFSIERVAIVDDDREGAQTVALSLEAAGYEPFIIEKSPGSAEALAKQIAAEADAAYCDHRLSRYAFATNFSGADVVAKLYDLKIPGVLFSEYYGIDADVSIRKQRRRIPVVLRRSEVGVGIQSITDSFNRCKEELEGMYPDWRRPHRSMLIVEYFGNQDDVDVVDVNIVNRDGGIVRFPLELIPEDLRDDLREGDLLIADVNIGAERSEDLYFENVQLAPEPEDDDGLA